MRVLLVVMCIMFSLVAISVPSRAEGDVPTSALRLREKRPLPPQITDMSKYDDVIELNIDERPDYFNYPGSKLLPVVAVEVYCRVDTKHNQSAPVKKYEDLFYSLSQPLGCKHFTHFPIPERHEIAIFVRSTSGSLSHAGVAACSNALVRLRLEATLNRNLIVTTRIPNDSLSDLIAELEKQNFLKYKEHHESIEVLIPIPLETELGQREMMCFVPTN